MVHAWHVCHNFIKYLILLNNAYTVDQFYKTVFYVKVQQNVQCVSWNILFITKQPVLMGLQRLNLNVDHAPSMDVRNVVQEKISYSVFSVQGVINYIITHATNAVVWLH